MDLLLLLFIGLKFTLQFKLKIALLYMIWLSEIYRSFCQVALFKYNSATTWNTEIFKSECRGARHNEMAKPAGKP